jgi:hypothetical protein
MISRSMIEGGCFCGKIRYQIDPGEYPAANCHCTMCRRVHAAPYVSWLVVPTDKFSYLDGSPKILKSSEKGVRYFCSDCGTHIACVNESHADIVDITIGSLDDPAPFSPSMDVFTDTRLDWVAHEG